MKQLMVSKNIQSEDVLLWSGLCNGLFKGLSLVFRLKLELGVCVFVGGSESTEVQFPISLNYKWSSRNINTG